MHCQTVAYHKPTHRSSLETSHGRALLARLRNRKQLSKDALHKTVYLVYYQVAHWGPFVSSHAEAAKQTVGKYAWS